MYIRKMFFDVTIMREAISDVALLMGKTVIILMVILDYYWNLISLRTLSFDWSKEWGALGVAKGPKGLDAY